MAFVIPEWEDGKSENAKVRKKTKIKQQDGSPKKKSVKNNTKVNGVAEKSKLINKLKIQQHNKQKNTDKKIKVLAKSQNKTAVGKNGLPIENKNNNQILKKSKRRKLEKQTKDNTQSNIKVDNIDIDKLDEVLLNAKKIKFNEAMRKDDIEDVLFGEDKTPEVKKKPLAKHKKNNSAIGRNVIKSTKVNRIDKAKTVKLTAAAGQNVNTSDEKTISPSQQVLQDRKKEKFRLMIKKENNRNPINLNRNKLRERMLDRLKSAQFRFINEKLYTSSGTEASELFKNDPAAFNSYHEGYQQQVKKWPVNPLDVIIKRIMKMPKSHQIADMGCGEAELARRVPHAVRSFDLQRANEQVEVCDMARTPLLAASVDAAVYCLALMGTDLTAYLLEANRVLKMGGHLLIAEVESRFEDVNAFTKDVTRLGFKLVKLNRDHEVFFFLEFVKNQAPPVKKSKLPSLTLKPCIYKRR